MNDLENEYVVGSHGTTYRAIDVFRTGEMQGTHNERLRIIELLESYFKPEEAKSIYPANYEQYLDLIALIKGEKK